MKVVRILVCAAVAVTALGSGAPSFAASPCAADKRVIRSCVPIHGKLYVPANMRTRLWPLDGSKHEYAIHIDDNGGGPTDFDPPMPENVFKLLDPEHTVFGDFTICPFTIDKPGKLQIGCIDSARHLVARKIDDE
jgi:hypothetical protein